MDQQRSQNVFWLLCSCDVWCVALMLDGFGRSVVIRACRAAIARFAEQTRAGRPGKIFDRWLANFLQCKQVL